jgi:hypothetical protein
MNRPELPDGIFCEAARRCPDAECCDSTLSTATVPADRPGEQLIVNFNQQFSIQSWP